VGAPTVYDVAARAGVSIATVSRVYRTPDSVRAQTRDRVLAAARELGYVPSGSARGLASRSTGVLGLCFPDQADPEIDELDEQPLYADEITRGMERAARRSGYALLIAASLADGPAGLVASVAGRVDGFAVLARTVATDDLELVARRLPVVMIAGPREVDRLDHVEVANRDGECELTTHLIAAHGLRRLAFVGGTADSPDSRARFLGYREALAAARLPVPPEPDTYGDFTQVGGRAATTRLLERGPLPQGLVFANDQMAIGAYDVLARRGLRIPEDVAVVGFDGIGLGRVVRPGLTTVAQPMRGLGETAVELLVDRLADPDREPRSVLLPVTVTRRTSCGCPRLG
jgi:LacI family transcriptional regulator